MQLNFYNSSGVLWDYQDAASGLAGTLTTTWEQKGGRVTTPANTATVKIPLHNYHNSGWVAYDDVTLTQVTATKYYYAGSQRVAMRQNGTLYWLLTDHPSLRSGQALGSTNKVANADGSFHSSIHYRSWGEVRATNGTLPTDYMLRLRSAQAYTGQYSHVGDFGLMYYVARWYDPALGRFAQADSIVPGAGNPLAWDRYAGMMNNPVRYTDPSGHLVCSDAHVAEGDCSNEGAGLWRFEGIVTYSGDGWDHYAFGAARREALRAAVAAVSIKLQEELGGTLWDAFRETYGKVEFTWGLEGAKYDCADITAGGCTTNAHQINFMSLAYANGNKTAEMAAIEARNNIVHELGHAFANLWYRKDGSYDPAGPYMNIPSTLQREDGFHTSPAAADKTWRQHPNDTSSNEIFADMFLGWTFDTWAGNKWGTARDDFMTTNMAEWIK